MNSEREFRSAGQNEPLPGLIDMALLWRRKWYVAFTVAATVALGVAYVRQAKPIYESAARILVDTSAASEQGKAIRDDKNFLPTQAEILWSPVTIESALKAVPEAAPSPSVDADGVPRDPVSQILNNLRVTPLQATNVLKIAIRGDDPQKSNQLLMAIIDTYAEQFRKMQLEESSASSQLLANREAKLREEMQGLRDRFREQRLATPLVGQGNDATSIQMSLLRNLDIRLAENRNRRMDLNNRLQVSAFPNDKGRFIPRVANAGAAPADALALSGAGDGFELPGKSFVAYGLAGAPLPNEVLPAFLQEENLLASAEIDKLRQQLLTAETTGKQLALQYGPKHPQIRAAQEEVAALESSLRESQQRAAAVRAQELEALHMEVEALKLTEDNLTEIYNKEMNQVKALDGFLLEEQDLLRQLNLLEETHQATATALADTQLTVQALNEGHSFVQVRVLEGPGSNESQVWPKPAQFLGICALVGLVGGCFLVTLFEASVQPVTRRGIQSVPETGAANRPALA